MERMLARKLKLQIAPLADITKERTYKEFIYRQNYKWVH